MHIFLTGVPGVGKSTIVSSVVEELHKEIAGFSTIGEPIVGNNPSNVVMYNLAAGREDSMIVAHRYGDGRYKGDAPAFDTFGTKTLLDFKEIDLVIMDELGFMENEAYAFQKMVMTVLDGDIPVLGVIKPRNTAFLDGVRRHRKVKLLVVKEENREEVKKKVLDDYRNQLK